jgi:RES domain-containing protein
MRLWRLGPARHPALDGEGARRASGRWNPRGVPMVYTSAHLSLAVLEKLVHVDFDTFPADVVSYEIEVPDDLPVRALELAALPRGWDAMPAPESTQAIGRAWVEDAASPGILSVPSVVVPRERNFLLNPSHPNARRWKVVHREPFRLDGRLLRATPPP